MLKKLTVAFIFILALAACVASAQKIELRTLKPVSEPLKLGDNASLQCSAGAGLVRETSTKAFNLVEVSGANVTIRGCIFDSNSGSGASIVVTGAHATIEDNQILNSNKSVAAIYLYNAAAPTVRDNYLTEVAGGTNVGQIFGEDSVTEAVIENNRLVSHSGVMGAHGIAFHTKTPGTALAHIRISGNDITAHGGFCVEVGNFGAANSSPPVLDVKIRDNKCRLAGDGDGGYSVLVVRELLLDHNSFQASGFRTLIAPIEIAKSQGTISNNTADLSGLGRGATCERCFSTIWTKNVITGLNAASRTTYGIHINVSPGAGVSDLDGISASDNVFRENRIEFASGPKGIGIWQQCNLKGARCVNNVYTGNRIVSPPSSGIHGVRLENEHGTTRNTRVAGNIMEGPGVVMSKTGRVKDTVLK